MSAEPSNAFLQAEKPPVPNTGAWCAGLRLRDRLYVVGALVLFFACSGILRGADPYAAALDKRFSAQTAPPEP